MDDIYDLAFVGSGVSAAYTLWFYLVLLAKHPPARPVRVVVFEKSGEFWAGIPYGRASGRASLLISSLEEFIPQTAEREDFKNWLTHNRERLLCCSREPAGQLAARWLREHQSMIASGEWDDLYLPRYLFGLYLRERLTTLIEDASAKGLAEFQLSASGIVDIGRSGDLHRLVPDSGEGAGILAKNVVLAVGSPPYTGVAQFPFDTARDEVCFINHVYEPSLDANMQDISERLTASGGGNVLILGTNASALETLYSLANSKTAMGVIGKIIMLSPDAAFPHRVNRDITPSHYRLVHLDALAQAESITSHDILAAVERDVAGATAERINIADLYHDISQRIIAALGRLDRREQEAFVADDGVEIGKLQRRAGPEYLDVAEGLIAEGKLELHKGRFVKYLSRDEGGPGCSYLEGRTGGPKVISAPISVVVNCAGFQDVTKSSSVLLRNLVRRGICTPNDSRRGIAINAEYEASPGCYVMGPLVAGNILGTFKVWHAESCTRIIDMSKQLAEVLARETGTTRRPTKPTASDRLSTGHSSVANATPR